MVGLRAATRPHSISFIIKYGNISAREQTLGDRMRSRLAEMCISVEMKGADFRQSIKRASFG